MSKRLSQYSDIAAVLNTVLEHQKAADLVLPSPGAAVHWRQRAYYFRRLFQQQSLTNTSPYDDITIRVEGSVAKILPNAKLASRLLIDGQEVALQDSQVPTALEEAAARLGLDIDD